MINGLSFPFFSSSFLPKNLHLLPITSLRLAITKGSSKSTGFAFRQWRHIYGKILFYCLIRRYFFTPFSAVFHILAVTFYRRVILSRFFYYVPVKGLNIWIRFRICTRTFHRPLEQMQIHLMTETNQHLIIREYSIFRFNPSIQIPTCNIWVPWCDSNNSNAICVGDLGLKGLSATEKHLLIASPSPDF